MGECMQSDKIILKAPQRKKKELANIKSNVVLLPGSPQENPKDASTRKKGNVIVTPGKGTRWKEHEKGKRTTGRLGVEREGKEREGAKPTSKKRGVINYDRGHRDTRPDFGVAGIERGGALHRVGVTFS